MRLPRSQQTAAALLLAVTAGLLAGCSTEDVAMARKACLQNKEACRALLADLNASLNPTVVPLQVETLSAIDYPKAVRDWFAAHSTQVAGTAITEGDFTYLAIAAGIKPSSGWTVQIDRIVQVQGSYRVEASVVPPSGGVLDVMLPAGGAFRVERLTGNVTFAITDPASTTTNPAPTIKPDPTIKPVPAPTPVESLSIQAASAEQAPVKLQEWVSSQRGLQQPEGKVLTVGNETWIALSGGVRPTGGYKVEIRNTYQANGTWVIEASVVPPPPGAMVIQVLTTPTAYFKTSAITGPVEIRWTEGQGPGLKQ